MASKNRSTPKQPPGSRGRAGLSFSERLAQLTVFVDRYQTSLATEGGSVLSARVRLAIAYAARQALLLSSSSCEEECHSKRLVSGRDACLRAGTTNIHQLLSGQEHYHVAPELAQALTNDNDALVVTGLIQAILNHQSRLDKAWYEATMQDLDQTTIIPPAITGDARKLFLQTLFCELVLVTTMAHSMNCLYLAIGQDPPALPELRHQEEGGRHQAEEPYWFDWTRALTSKKTAAAASAGLYYDGKAWAPYLPRFAVDTRSLEFIKIPGMAQDNLVTFFRWRGLAPVPYVAMTYAVADFIWFMHWFELAYVSQMRFFQPFRPLDGTMHCSGSVSRQDLEIVATAVAAAHQCTF
jgi:hypothetical protein